MGCGDIAPFQHIEGSQGKRSPPKRLAKGTGADDSRTVALPYPPFRIQLTPPSGTPSIVERDCPPQNGYDRRRAKRPRARHPPAENRIRPVLRRRPQAAAFRTAKKQAGEETSRLSRENFKEFVKKKTRDLQKQKNCRDVEYVVEVVGGQVKLKALVKA